MAALAPLMLTVSALAFSLFALTQGSNLWPLTLIFTAIAGAVYLGLLFLLHLCFAEQTGTAAPSPAQPPNTSASVSAITSVALYKSDSGRRSSARWALASSMVRGPAP
jgi:hypothetical protein